MSVEIKPCPFCGNRPKVVKTLTEYRVHCNYDCSGYFSKKGEAISTWNKRVDDSERLACEHNFKVVHENYQKALAFIRDIKGERMGLDFAIDEFLEEIGE